MRRTVVMMLVALATLATGSASQRFAPTTARSTPEGRTTAEAHQPDGPPERPSPRPAPTEQRRVRVTVSGPSDTVMRVARGNAHTRVELGDTPFDFSFVEPPGATGYRDIAVWAGSARTHERPLRCAITVNGKPIARRSATERTDAGLATVVCDVPDPV